MVVYYDPDRGECTRFMAAEGFREESHTLRADIYEDICKMSGMLRDKADKAWIRETEARRRKRKPKRS